jgi:Coenzyme PQQ synthesis protein D (PqqD)
MDADTTIARSPRAAFRQMADGTAVILHLDTTAYHTVNETGAAIWELLDEERTFGAVVEGLAAQLDERPASLEADAATFVEALAERGLVTLGDA